MVGAAHAVDLPFTFGTLDVDRWRTFAGADSPEADRLSSRMRAAWAAFCHDADGRTLVRLGLEVGAVEDLLAARTRALTGRPAGA